MIPNQWYIVLESKEVKKGKLLGVTRFGEKLVFGRTKENELFCLRDKCAHRGAALSAGKVKDGRVQCPFHGFEYDQTGRAQLLPAKGRSYDIPERFKVDSYPVKESAGFIWFWHGDREPKTDPPFSFFDEFNKMVYSTYIDHWPMHYSRTIENQLDVFHLPFVHHNTIGRGNQTVADGPIAELNGEEIHAWVFNRRDDGTVAKKPAELTKPDKPPMIRFRFPNIWRLGLGKRVKVFLAFVPVDEQNTVLYLRFYQSFFKIPGLRNIINYISNRFNRVILHQDKRVVLTQKPIKSLYKMGENLITGDLPIILYRRHRQELIDLNP